jgi:diguanylate cyclase (GGDEF)-like protein/PAS domain S-box-containing protein
VQLKKSITNQSTKGRLKADTSKIEGLIPSFGPLFDTSMDQIMVLDALHRVVYINDAALKQNAMVAEQVLGQAYATAFAKNQLLQYGEVLDAVTRSKRPEVVTKAKGQKQTTDTILSVAPIINAEQSLLGLLIIKQSAEVKPLLEQELTRTSVYHKTILDSIPFMIWLKDKDSRILAANIAYAEMAGASDTKLLEGKTDYDFWSPLLAKTYIEDDLKVMESGEPIILVEKVKKKNGSASWAETYKAPVIVNNEVIGTVGYARDISEERRLLSTITEKDLQFTSLLKNLPLTIVRYDTNCKRTFVNTNHENASVLIGKTPEEMWIPTIKNITAEEFQARLMHVLFHGEKQTFEMQCEEEGKIIVNMVTLLPEFDEHHQVIGALTIANDVSEISKYRDDLEYMAYHDALTALPNRTLVNQELQKLAKAGSCFALLFMDLDLFKEINDTLGHVVGDELLVEAAKRIASTVRAIDTVARIGGDEFAILVSDYKDKAQLKTLAEKIAEKLSAPFTIDEINFFVSASIGIACYPTDSDSVEDLIKYADTAMYDAKKQGRNNFQFYSPELTQEAMEHLAIATALRYAIQKKEFFLLYQPKVDMSSGRVVGAECLLRWHGHVLGQIEPDKFIPIAEESGLIIDIGAWVLETSCKVAAQLNKDRQEPLNIAINVSTKEFSGNCFIENLQRCLETTGCRPEWITLEMTESLLLQDTNLALETLMKIDKMGITLSIDDFGTGYSALAYLSKFPIKQVKIDRSFVMDITHTASAASLVKAIIAMAQSLNKELVAEGIETEEQAKLLKEYGCNQAQGYFYSKPLPFSAFLHVVSQQMIH